nr:hypothetical protein Iba_chr01aCG2690 [Ipomoea batatas]
MLQPIAAAAAALEPATAAVAAVVVFEPIVVEAAAAVAVFDPIAAVVVLEPIAVEAAAAVVAVLEPIAVEAAALEPLHCSSSMQRILEDSSVLQVEWKHSSMVVQALALLLQHLVGSSTHSLPQKCPRALLRDQPHNRSQLAPD